MPKKYQQKKTSGINPYDYVVFDFETGGKNPFECEPIQVAAMVFNARKLTPVQNGTFVSMMRPPGEEKDWKIEAEALDINKKTMEQIREAPSQEEVWKNFYSFVRKYNKGTTAWTAPIACGQNIVNFDLIIAERMSRRYNLLDKDGKFSLFNRRTMMELMHMHHLWFENMVEPVDYSMDTLREFYGISKEGAHDALVDVKQTADIIFRIIRLHRKLVSSIPFKGAFSREADNRENQ